MVSATKTKNNFGEILDRALVSDEPIPIERHGKPIAILVSARGWKAHCGVALREPSPWLRRLLAVRQRIKENGQEQESAVDMVRQLREEAM
jgi:prevent-host-death family protein